MKDKICCEMLEFGYAQLSAVAQNPTEQGEKRVSVAMALADWQRVDDLAAEIGAEAVVEVVAMFLEETDEVIMRLAAATPTTEDYHFLKGSALNLGLTDLATLCQLGEQEAKAGIVSRHTQAAVLALYPASKDALLEGIAARFGD